MNDSSVSSGWIRSLARRRTTWLISACAAIVLLLVGSRVVGQRAKLDPDEQRLRKTIGARLPTEALPFLERTVDTNSGTLDREGVLATAALYEPRFARLGFTTSRIDLGRVQRGCHLVA